MDAALQSGEVIKATISTEIDGQTYTGSYAIEDGWITVSCAHGSKRAGVLKGAPGWLPPQDGFARLLLGEVIGEAIRTGRLKA